MTPRSPFCLATTGMLLLAAGLWAGRARAEEGLAPSVSFSGFGTASLVHSSERNADYSGTEPKPEGAGFSRSWSGEVDTLVAAQVSARVTDKLSVILQVISEQNYAGSYRPFVEWANIRYQPIAELAIRVGRTQLPIFMVSDTRKIGYSNPWVRPPPEVYGLVPVTRNDGVDLSYRARFGDSSNTFQATAGRSDSKFPNHTDGQTINAQARSVLTLVDIFERGFLTMRVNYGRTRVTIAELGVLFDAFRQFGPEGIAIAQRYDVNDSLVTFAGVGASYDPGKWFIAGEWGRINTHSVLGGNRGWYATGGYRFGKLTPYLTYARGVSTGTKSDRGLTVSALPPFLAGPATALNSALNAALAPRFVLQTTTIGGRWDFARNAALKLQLDHIRNGAGVEGYLIRVRPGFRPGGSLTVFSASVDFVF